MEYRLAKRKSFCRGCDKVLQKEKDSAIFMYSIRNRGQNIMLCDECIETAYNLMKEFKDDCQ